MDRRNALKTAAQLVAPVFYQCGWYLDDRPNGSSPGDEPDVIDLADHLRDLTDQLGPDTADATGGTAAGGHMRVTREVVEKGVTRTTIVLELTTWDTPTVEEA